MRVQQAFQSLFQRPGFGERSGQLQAALLLNDCIEGGMTALIEAPTGLGKSLATLIPSIACAIESGKKTVIATYTNVLAEQYWRKDLPLARSLLEDTESALRAEFLIGRSRYLCRQAVLGPQQPLLKEFFERADLGIESEFRDFARIAPKDRLTVWKQLQVPAVCPGRVCPSYNDCYYYRARRSVEKANLIITNHSVVIQDALLKQASKSELSLLGEYDFLILDEAHDFLSAARSGLEFELSKSKLDAMVNIAHRLHSELSTEAVRNDAGASWVDRFLPFLSGIQECQSRLEVFGMSGDGSFLRVSPNHLLEHPNLRQKGLSSNQSEARAIADLAQSTIKDYLTMVEDVSKSWGTKGEVSAMVRTYSMYLSEFAESSQALLHEPETAWPDVSYTEGGEFREPKLRRDLIDFQHVLQGLIWDKGPWACISATLALDGSFDFFNRSLGTEPEVSEILESPFDFSAQAALYVPPTGRIPDPTQARKEGRTDDYLACVAREVAEVIKACDGRTLVLFSSRKEMEAVYARMTQDPARPIYMQRTSGAAHMGERFKKEIHSSLFAVRSFWTGFDAAGETLTCVCIIRVPFEVPFDPVALARMAYLQANGRDPFVEYTLPLAKMMMRQGSGRLIRRDADRGIIAVLDPRLRTKSYGEQIFENLPRDMRSFDNIWDAVAHILQEPDNR